MKKNVHVIIWDYLILIATIIQIFHAQIHFLSMPKSKTEQYKCKYL